MLTAHAEARTYPTLRHTVDGDTPIPSKFLLRNLLRTTQAQTGLTDLVIDELVTRAQIVTRRPGARLATAPAGGQLLHFLLAGAARIECRNVTVRIVPPGWLLDPAPVAAGIARQVSVHTHVPSLVATLPRRTVESALARLPARFMLQMTMLGWQRVAETLFQKCAARTLPLRERLLCELRVLAGDFGQPRFGAVTIDLPLSQGHLARLAAASRSNVCRMMRTLREERMVDVIGNRIVLLDGALGSRPGASSL